MGHWQQALPGWILDVRHEDLVRHFEPWLGALKATLGDAFAA